MNKKKRYFPFLVVAWVARNVSNEKLKTIGATTLSLSFLLWVIYNNDEFIQVNRLHDLSPNPGIVNELEVEKMTCC